MVRLRFAEAMLPWIQDALAAGQPAGAVRDDLPSGIAGIPYSRATVGPWAILEPVSVIRPPG